MELLGLIVGFALSWFFIWLVVVRPICSRLDKVNVGLYNVDCRLQQKGDTAIRLLSGLAEQHPKEAL
jgi:hypothetical protein